MLICHEKHDCHTAEHLCVDMNTSFSHEAYLHGKPNCHLSPVAERGKGSGQQVSGMVLS